MQTFLSLVLWFRKSVKHDYIMAVVQEIDLGVKMETDVEFMKD